MLLNCFPSCSPLHLRSNQLLFSCYPLSASYIKGIFSLWNCKLKFSSTEISWLPWGCRLSTPPAHGRSLWNCLLQKPLLVGREWAMGVPGLPYPLQSSNAKLKAEQLPGTHQDNKRDNFSQLINWVLGFPCFGERDEVPINQPMTN